MSHSNTAFHQLLKPLSRHEFEAEAKRHHVGQKLRSASRWDQFVVMAMSAIERIFSQPSGNTCAKLRNGQMLTISKGYKRALKAYQLIRNS